MNNEIDTTKRTTLFLEVFNNNDKKVKKAIYDFLIGMHTLRKLNSGDVYWNFKDFYTSHHIITVLCPSFTCIEYSNNKIRYNWNNDDLYIPSQIFKWGQMDIFEEFNDIEVYNDYSDEDIYYTELNDNISLQSEYINWDDSLSSKYQTGC